MKIATALLATVLLMQTALAETWRDELPHAKLVGQGDFRWLFFDVYEAKLWSERIPFEPNSSFALELTYHRPFTSAQFVNSSIDEIKRIHGSAYSTGQLQSWAKKLGEIFPDVHKGDKLIGIFLPNKGCRFFDKNKALGAVSDPELAKAFFAIWLDERTRDTQLRANLMGAGK